MRQLVRQIIREPGREQGPASPREGSRGAKRDAGVSKITNGDVGAGGMVGGGGAERV